MNVFKEIFLLLFFLDEKFKKKLNTKQKSNKIKLLTFFQKTKNFVIFFEGFRKR